MEARARDDLTGDLNTYLRHVFGNQLGSVSYTCSNNVQPLYSLFGGVSHEVVSTSYTMAIEVVIHHDLNAVQQGLHIRGLFDRLETNNCHLINLQSNACMNNLNSSTYYATYRLVDIETYVDELEKKSWDFWNLGMNKLIDGVLSDPDKE